MKALRINYLKAKARRAYERYWRELSELSCGRTLGEEISPGMMGAKREFNETMERLAKLDPGCPATRL